MIRPLVVGRSLLVAPLCTGFGCCTWRYTAHRRYRHHYWRVVADRRAVRIEWGDSSGAVYCATCTVVCAHLTLQCAKRRTEGHRMYGKHMCSVVQCTPPNRAMAGSAVRRREKEVSVLGAARFKVIDAMASCGLDPRSYGARTQLKKSRSVKITSQQTYRFGFPLKSSHKSTTSPRVTGLRSIWKRLRLRIVFVGITMLQCWRVAYAMLMKAVLLYRSIRGGVLLLRLTNKQRCLSERRM